MAAQQQNQQRAILNWMLQNMDPTGSQMALIQLQQQQQQLLVAAALKAKNAPSKESAVGAQILMAKLIAAGVAQQQHNLFQEQNPTTIAAHQLIIGQLQRQFAQQINSSTTIKENDTKNPSAESKELTKSSSTHITPSIV